MGTFARALAVLFSAGLGVGLGFALHRVGPLARYGEPPAATPTPSAARGAPSASTPAASASSHSASPAASASSQGSASPAASGAPAASGSSGAPRPGPSSSAGPSTLGSAPLDDVPACIRATFSDDTFASDPTSLAKICEEKSPPKIIKRIKEAVVAGSGGKVSGGMKEWGMLGIYEIAAIAAIRGRCCPDAVDLDLPAPGGSCSGFVSSVLGVSKAAKPGMTPQDLDAAVAAFEEDARCIMRSDQEKLYGDYGPLGGGERTTLDKTLDRLRGAAKR